MAETDVILMSLVIFVPSLFALVLLFFPKGTEEYMRWWSLLGTAVTLVLSLCLFIDYYNLLDPFKGQPERQQLETSLASRVRAADQKLSVHEPADSKDLVSRYPWIRQFNIDYFLGIDGISMPLLLLTTVISFLAMIASWNIDRYVKGYCALFLLLETGMVGTFLALDFFLFYIFWEVMLLPMYFLIGVWGGPQREYAAIKFFLYTLLGSVFILIALLGFYFTDIRDYAPAARPNEPRNSFDLIALQRAGKVAAVYLNAEAKDREVLTKAAIAREGNAEAKKNLDVAFKRVESQSFFSSGHFQLAMFLLLFVGFAIKVPIFPFHTWLPDAHVEAPTPISMILAGILLKMGGYGILRIAYPICPWAAETLAFWIALLGVINIVYGAFAAMAQTDFKKLVAYSSISHMGYVVLGIAVWAATKDRSQYWTWGMNGAMFQMIAHGISSAGMFFLVGVIYDRAHHRNLNDFRGLYEPMPLYGGVSAIIFFAALGLPGLCGFVGEFMVILSTWDFAPAIYPIAGRVFAVLAALTVVLTAGYILWTIQRVYLGTNPAYQDYPDITLRELICILPLVVLAVVLGVLPYQTLLSWMEPHVTDLVKSLAQVSR